MRRFARLLVTVSAAAAVAAPLAAGADRMWAGFHDDPVLRWDTNRIAALDRAQSANATILRTLVTWAQVAPTRPARPANPFDSAYKLDDVDETIRNAQMRGQEVLITIWGTPKWANGGKTPNFAPRNMKDLQLFARALAARYSGRYPGYPFVRFYGVWNESNFGQFLSPQFNAAGKIVGPRVYAQIAAAAYKGIKSGNRRALVAVGETASHGRDRKSGGSDSIAPATFARLLAAASPRLKFDAYAMHPYPFPVSMKPDQRMRWPNVNLESLTRFETSLDGWFKRRNIPIWITEYGHETRPAEPKGVTEAKQAAYVMRAVAMAKADPRVEMFIWFVFEDSKGSLWQSGLNRGSGVAKPALSRWTRAVAALDARNPSVNVRAGTRSPTVRLVVRELCANNPAGTLVGMTWQASTGVAGQPTSSLGVDCSVSFKAAGLTVGKSAKVTLRIALNTKNGSTASRTATLVAK